MVKQIIGLDRELKLRWLDIAAGLVQHERDKLALRAQLMETLASEIPAHFVRVKTCTILIRTWLTVPSQYAHLRDLGLDLLHTVPPEQRMTIHWGMLILAYPFFRQSAIAIGRAAISQETVIRQQVMRRITEDWGERTTVRRCELRVFQTLADWGVLIRIDDEQYNARAPLDVDYLPLAEWMAQVTLRARNAAMPLDALTQSPENFPFRLVLTLSDLTRSGRFSTFREGGDLLIGL